MDQVKALVREPITVQAVGAILLCVGFGLWLGVAAASLCAGICLLVAGTLMELTDRSDADGSGPADPEGE